MSRGLLFCVVWLCLIGPLTSPSLESIEGTLTAPGEEHAELAIPRHLVGDDAFAFARPHADPVSGQWVPLGGPYVAARFAGAGGATGRAPLVLTTALGPQKTLMLSLRFSDQPAGHEISAAQMTAMMARTGRLNSYMLEVSGGRTWFDTTVAGPLAMDLSSKSSCDIRAIALAAQRAATISGIDVSAFPRLVLVWNYAPNNCGWRGRSTGGARSVTWSYVFKWNNLAHELGHAMGLSHARALDCVNAVMTGRCRVKEYGDPIDLMAAPGRLGAFGSKAREVLGWTQPGDIVEATAGTATYHLVPYLTSPEIKGPRTIRVRKNEASWYYLEYRQPTGVDAYLGVERPKLTQGIMVRQAQAGARNADALDMRPGPGGDEDWNDATLPVGMTWTDPDARVSITLVSADASGATLQIAREP